MAWIESHQEIGRHPKTRKAARRLEVSVPQMVGHLHLLWHWALDYAETGALNGHDNEDVALGALWEGDPDEFVQVLTDVGFIDTDRTLHDWWEYAGRLVKDRIRKREARAKTVQGQSADSPTTEPGLVPEESADVPRAGTQHNPTREAKASRPKRPPKGAGPKENTYHAVLEDLFGIPSDTEVGLRRKVVRSVMAAGAEPDDVRARAEAWRELFPVNNGRKHPTLTVTALDKWWGQLGQVVSDKPEEFDPDNCPHPDDRRAVIEGDEFCGLCRREL